MSWDSLNSRSTKETNRSFIAPSNITPTSCQTQAISTRPVVEQSFVNMVAEVLEELNCAVNRLDNLKDLLAPNKAKDRLCSSDPKAAPQPTFDYVWGVLPEVINSRTNTIVSFCDFMRELVYKDCCKEASCSSDNPSDPDHVVRVNSSIESFMNSLNRLEGIPDMLSNQEKPVCEMGDEETSRPCFHQIWRELPDCIMHSVKRIRSVEAALTNMLTVVEKNSEANFQEKH